MEEQDKHMTAFTTPSGLRDAFPLLHIEEALDALGNASIFTTLDFTSGYCQVEVEEQYKHKTVFTTPSGLYECNRMPFGLQKTPATFQRLTTTCLGDLNYSTCLLYLDDIIVFSATFEEHIQRLDKVFSCLRQHGLKLKPSKCNLLQKEVKYLGHVVSAQGIATDPDKRKSSLPAPPYVWTAECQSAFNTLKTLMTTAPILAYADYNLPFILQTDASGTGLGAILSQIQHGHERIIAYASRGLSPSEKRYPAHTLEFLALKWAITDKLRDYLLGAQIQVLTDNNPLLYVTTTAKLDATGQRWVAALSQFNFSVKDKPGNNNADADALSRKEHP